MGESDTEARRSRNWASITVAAGITVFGLLLVTGLGYAQLTKTVESDYAEYSANCGELTNRSVLVDAGLGMEREELDETDVQVCENSSFEEYRDGRYWSMLATPLNPGQWLLFGGTGGTIAVGGAVILRQELR